jgi:hypothetical protein
MSVYFIIDRESDAVKIGRSKRPKKRLVDLQTGNPNRLELMGWIEPKDDSALELALHRSYAPQHRLLEWFNIDMEDVLSELKRYAGFVPKNADAFEIIGYDRDGIPEYVGVCEWQDFEYEECCPFCGCMRGMYFNEAAEMYHCLTCDELTTFEFLNPNFGSDERD